MIPWWHTRMGLPELLSVANAFRQRRFSMGAVTEELEEKLAEKLNVAYVVAAPSGTAALTMALMAVGVEAGDEIVVPDLTWIATGQAASILGAKIVLVDGAPVVDPRLLEKAVSARTKAVIVVHNNGHPVEMAPVLDAAHRYGATVVEDACKALGSRAKWGYLGTMGDMGCFSLGMVSLVSCGYGGLVVTHDPRLHKRLRRIRDHGVIRGRHEAYVDIGYNFKWSDLLAALGLAQVRQWNRKREHLIALHDQYRRGMEGMTRARLVLANTEGRELPLLAEALSPEREALLDYLAYCGIQAVPGHLPLHTWYDPGGHYPASSGWARESLYLPSGPDQPLRNVRRVITALRRWEYAGQPAGSVPTGAAERGGARPVGHG